jgi:hypothetical protein
MAIHVVYKNPSISNGIKITMQDAVRDDKNKIIPGKFKKGAVKFVKPANRGQPGEDVVEYWLDTGRGVLVEEMPT